MHVLTHTHTHTHTVSENKVLTHPSSVDSISTSAGQEDHVSMGGYAARKALQVVQHVEHVRTIHHYDIIIGQERIRKVAQVRAYNSSRSLCPVKIIKLY